MTWRERMFLVRALLIAATLAGMGWGIAGVDRPTRLDRPVPPLVAPPQCEGKPDVGFCFLDLSDGREYVIYTDPITGDLAWYEQDWKDGS
jgi:hypothetical protein